MDIRSSTAVLLIVVVVVSLSIGVVTALEISPAHEHTSHEYHVEDVAYDEQHDIVWSIDNELEADSVRFVGYAVESEEVVIEKPFSSGQAIADGDGVVYIAEDNQLWEFHVETEETSLLAEMEHHPSSLAYDESRGLVWAGQAGAIVAFDAEDGEEIHRHEEHGQGQVSSLSVEGKYVASVLTWEPNVIVYDIENEAVAFEPLPDPIEAADDGNIVSVHLTESGEVILGGGWDSVFMYDIESEELLRQYGAHAFGVQAIKYHESEGLIISAGFGNQVAFYDVESEDLVNTYDHGDTIFAGDLDREHDIFWYGDGEDPPEGTITGLRMAFDDSETGDEGTTTDGDESAGDSTDDTVADTADDTQDGSDSADSSDGQAGMGVFAVLTAFVVVLFGRRFHNR